MIDIRVEAAERIARVAAEVRLLGDGREIVNQMAKEIRQAVPPVRKAVRGRFLKVLPKRGGFAVWMTKASIRASVRRGAKSAGVSLVAGRNAQGHRADLRRLDRTGVWRHPYFNNRKEWYPQATAPGFFSEGVQEQADEFRDAIVRAVNKAERTVFG